MYVDAELLRPGSSLPHQTPGPVGKLAAMALRQGGAVASGSARKFVRIPTFRASFGSGVMEMVLEKA